MSVRAQVPPNEICGLQQVDQTHADEEYPHQDDSDEDDDGSSLADVHGSLRVWPLLHRY